MSTKERWKGIHESGRTFTPIKEAEVDSIIEKTGHPTTALDIASGTGDLLLKLARRGITVTGVDFVEEAHALAQRAFEAAGLQATFVEADFNEPDFVSKLGGPYEIVFMRLALTFVKDADSLLEQVKTVLTPGGSFVCTLPGLLPGVTYDNHQRGISLPKDELEATLNRHFTTVELLTEDMLKPDWPLLTYLCRQAD